MLQSKDKVLVIDINSPFYMWTGIVSSEVATAQKHTPYKRADHYYAINITMPTKPETFIFLTFNENQLEKRHI